MKKKEIYALVGVLVLIVIFVVLRPLSTPIEEPVGENGVTSQNSRPNSSVSKSPTSVNPTVSTTKPVPAIPTPKSLDGSTFRLATYNGTPLPADTKYTLAFTDTSFTLKLCNNMSSTYYISGNTFKANNVISTAMYCSIPANLMKIESDASFMFSSGATSIYRSGSTLILSNPQGIVMAFEGF